MKKKTRKFTATTLLLMGMHLISFHASAVEPKSDKQKLAELSRIELIDGDARFLIAELLKDGLLQENEKASVQYNNKSVRLNGKEIPEPYNSRYVQMLLNGGFVTNGESSGTLSSDGQTISTLAGKVSSKMQHSTHYRQNYSRLIRLLVEDKIADGANNLTVSISADNVAINGRILVTPVEITYAYHLRELSGFMPANAEVFTIEIKQPSR